MMRQEATNTQGEEQREDDSGVISRLSVLHSYCWHSILHTTEMWLLET